MFTQRKRRNYTPLYIALGLLLAIALAFIFWPNNEGTESDATDENSVISSANKAVAQEQIKTEPKENKGTEKYETYYLLKTDKNSIKIYFSDDTGKLTMLEDSNIIYETLTEEDQNRFDAGVKVNSRDQLNELIMNYES